VTEPSEGAQLADAAGRGHESDRLLARAIGRPEPAGQAPAARYLDDLLRREPVEDADEQRLVEAAKRGDPRARERLVEAFMPRLAGVARMYRASPMVERQELLQEGAAALLSALEDFDPGRGTPFWAFASRRVHRAMRRLVNELARPVVLSDRGLRQLGRLHAAEEELAAETRREPTSGELAERAGLPRERVEELLLADRPPRSTEAPLSDRGMPVGRVEDRIADPRAEEAYERLLDEIEGEELRALMSGLSPRERQVLYALYGDEEKSRREVAEELGLTPERVEQIERRALRKLGACGPRATA
jgi:RNA polymerase primary sigma factor